MPEINPECSSTHVNHYSFETSSFPVAWNSTHKLGWPISDPKFWDCKFILLCPALQTKNFKKQRKKEKKKQFWDLNHSPSAQKSLTSRGISTIPREVILKSFTAFFSLKHRKPYTQAGLELMASERSSPCSLSVLALQSSASLTIIIMLV